MNILIVTSDPRGQSFAATLADRYAAGASAGAAAVVALEHADLAREGFDPRMTEADLAYYRGAGALPAEIRREQQRIERADVVVLAFPVYWWSMPALLKGWIDRVFTTGWAFGGSDRFAGPLSQKKVRLIATASGGPRLYDRHGYRTAMAAQIEHGIFNFSGVRDVATHFFFDIEGRDEAARLRNLAAAEDLGRTLAAELAGPALPGAA